MFEPPICGPSLKAVNLSSSDGGLARGPSTKDIRPTQSSPHGSEVAFGCQNHRYWKEYSTSSPSSTSSARPQIKMQHVCASPMIWLVQPGRGSPTRGQTYCQYLKVSYHRLCNTYCTADGKNLSKTYTYYMYTYYMSLEKTYVCITERNLHI